MGLAIEALISHGGRRCQEEATSDHSDYEGQTEEDERMIFEESSIALADGADAGTGLVGCVLEDCHSRDDGAAFRGSGSIAQSASIDFETEHWARVCE